MEGLLTGKSVIVTGGAQGIGRCLAKRIASLGAKVCVADIDTEASRQTVSELCAAGYSALEFTCDITSRGQAEKLAAEVLTQFGSIDVLINNAGFFPIKMFEELSQEEWQRVIDINLTGTFLVTKAVYGHMADRGAGKIINFASVAGRVGGFGFVHYSAAKAGVIGFTRALAREAAQVGIQVNAIAPGIVETNTAKSTFPEFALKEYIKNVPLGRLGKEEDVAGLVIFLCSSGSDYITGQVFAVDGGYTMI